MIKKGGDLDKFDGGDRELEKPLGLFLGLETDLWGAKLDKRGATIHFKQCCCASIHRQKSMGFELEKILGNFIIIKFKLLGFELEKILGNFLLNSEFWISN